MGPRKLLGFDHVVDQDGLITIVCFNRVPPGGPPVNYPAVDGTNPSTSTDTQNTQNTESSSPHQSQSRHMQPFFFKPTLPRNSPKSGNSSSQNSNQFGFGQFSVGPSDVKGFENATTMLPAESCGRIGLMDHIIGE